MKLATMRLHNAATVVVQADGPDRFQLIKHRYMPVTTDAGENVYVTEKQLQALEVHYAGKVIRL